jgi:hypothetical protein
MRTVHQSTDRGFLPNAAKKVIPKKHSDFSRRHEAVQRGSLEIEKRARERPNRRSQKLCDRQRQQGFEPISLSQNLVAECITNATSFATPRS